MRILLVSPGRLPVPATKGGAVETLIELLIDYNEKYLEHEISLLAISDETALEKQEEYKKTTFYNVTIGRIAQWLTKYHIVPYRWLDAWFSLRCVSIIKKSKVKFDVIVVENELVNGRVIHKFIKGNYLYHGHNDTLEEKKHSDVEFLKSCQRVMCISDYLTHRFNQKAGGINVHTVYNGVDTKLFHPSAKESRTVLRQRYGIKDDEILVVFAAGRLVPEKGIEPLIQALLQLPEDSRVKLLILGASFFDESRENKFVRNIRRISDSKRSQIIFSGYVKHEDMPKYYGMGDIGCVPSLWEEPFGLTVIEQMAMELPVITTDSGAIPEIVDERTGYIFARDNYLSQNIANAILTLSTHPEQRYDMGIAGRKRVCEKFSQEEFCKAWFDAVTWRNYCDKVF